jgi:hypothetical protein
MSRTFSAIIACFIPAALNAPAQITQNGAVSWMSGPTPGIYDANGNRATRTETVGAISGRTRDLVIFSGGTSVQEHEGETGATPANTATPDMEYIRGSDLSHATEISLT